MFGHGGADRIEAVRHDGPGKSSTVVRLHPDQTRGAGGKQESGGKEGEAGSHGQSSGLNQEVSESPGALDSCLGLRANLDSKREGCKVKSIADT